MANETRIAPAEWNLYVYQGDVLPLRLTLTKDGSPLDLSAAVITAQVRRRGADVEPQAVFSVEEQRADGFLHIELSAEQTSTLLPGVWDLQITLDGKPRTYLRGTVQVSKDVTR